MDGSGQTSAETVGRYAIHDEIASGGMASIHLGRVVGAGDVVAIKRMHPHFAKDPDFRSMFIDEARVAARIRHPNVVPTLEIVERDGQLMLVMEHVNGESLARLLRTLRERGEHVPVAIAASIVSSVLHGLHAAHEATNEAGEPLGIVHRDVSPANVLVGADGVTRVLDFGVAKARGRLQTTREGQLKGKLSYMAPEQVDGRGVDRRTDVFCAGAVLWEVLSGRRLFDGVHEAAVIAQLIAPDPAPPSTLSPDLEPFDEIVFGALQANPSLRYATALEMAEALEAAVTPAKPSDVARWVHGVAGDEIGRRARRVAELEKVPTLDSAETPAEDAPFLAALEGLAPPPQPPPQPALWHDSAPRAHPLTVPSSQVSSISVTTTRIEPPPVPPAQVKRLVAVGAASAVLVALFTFLVLPARNAVPETITPSATPAVSTPAVPPPTHETDSPPPAEPSAPPPTSAAASASAPPPTPPRPQGKAPSPQLQPMREPPAEWAPQPKTAKPPASAPAVRSPFGK